MNHKMTRGQREGMEKRGLIRKHSIPKENPSRSLSNSQAISNPPQLSSNPLLMASNPFLAESNSHLPLKLAPNVPLKNLNALKDNRLTLVHRNIQKIRKPVQKPLISGSNYLKQKPMPLQFVPDLLHLASKSLIKSESQPESAVLSESQPESAELSESHLESAESSEESPESQPESSELFKSQPKLANLSELQPELSELSESQPELSKLSESQPELSELYEFQPELSELSESQPELSELSESQPELYELSESQPELSRLSESRPELSELSESQLESYELSESQPKLSEPSESQPKLSEPSESQPKLSEPSESQPKLSEPSESQPKLSEPSESQPKLSEPSESQSKLSEPSKLQPESSELQPNPSKSSESLPKSSELQTELFEMQTELSESPPELSELPPELSESPPELSESPPELSKPQPELSKPQPELSKPQSELSQSQSKSAVSSESQPEFGKSSDTQPESVESQPKSAGSQPESAGSQPKSAESQPELAGSQPESAGLQPESAGLQLESAVSQPESAGPQPESAGPQPESAGPQPESAGSQPESAGSQSESAGSQPESAGSQLESAGSQPESAGSQPESAGSQPESAGSQPESAGSQPDSAGSQPDSAGSQPESAGSQPESVGSQPKLSDLLSKFNETESSSLHEQSKPPHLAIELPQLSSKPLQPSSKPHQLRSKPPQPASRPPQLRSKSLQPKPKPHQPSAKSFQPASKPPAPTSKPPAPTSKPPAPTSKPPAPTSKPPAPTSKPSAPTSKPFSPTSKPPAPTSKPPALMSKPPALMSKPPAPMSKPPAPPSKPHLPESKPSQPESKPSQPESKPSQLESKPSQLESKPSQPESKPSQPESKPSQPESKPSQPESKPSQPESNPPLPASKSQKLSSKPLSPNESLNYNGSTISNLHDLRHPSSSTEQLSSIPTSNPSTTVSNSLQSSTCRPFQSNCQPFQSACRPFQSAYRSFKSVYPPFQQPNLGYLLQRPEFCRKSEYHSQRPAYRPPNLACPRRQEFQHHKLVSKPNRPVSRQYRGVYQDLRPVSQNYRQLSQDHRQISQNHRTVNDHNSKFFSHSQRSTTQPHLPRALNNLQRTESLPPKPASFPPRPASHHPRRATCSTKSLAASISNAIPIQAISNQAQLQSESYQNKNFSQLPKKEATKLKDKIKLPDIITSSRGLCASLQSTCSYSETSGLPIQCEMSHQRSISSTTMTTALDDSASKLCLPQKEYIGLTETTSMKLIQAETSELGELRQSENDAHFKSDLEIFPEPQIRKTHYKTPDNEEAICISIKKNHLLNLTVGGIIVVKINFQNFLKISDVAVTRPFNSLKDKNDHTELLEGPNIAHKHEQTLEAESLSLSDQSVLTDSHKLSFPNILPEVQELPHLLTEAPLTGSTAHLKNIGSSLESTSLATNDVLLGAEQLSSKSKGIAIPSIVDSIEETRIQEPLSMNMHHPFIISSAKKDSSKPNDITDYIMGKLSGGPTAADTKLTPEQTIGSETKFLPLQPIAEGIELKSGLPIETEKKISQGPTFSAMLNLPEPQLTADISVHAIKYSSESGNATDFTLYLEIFPELQIVKSKYKTLGNDDTIRIHIKKNHLLKLKNEGITAVKVYIPHFLKITDFTVNLQINTLRNNTHATQHEDSSSSHKYRETLAPQPTQMAKSLSAADHKMLKTSQKVTAGTGYASTANKIASTKEGRKPQTQNKNHVAFNSSFKLPDSKSSQDSRIQVGKKNLQTSETSFPKKKDLTVTKSFGELLLPESLPEISGLLEPTLSFACLSESSSDGPPTIQENIASSTTKTSPATSVALVHRVLTPSDQLYTTDGCEKLVSQAESKSHPQFALSLEMQDPSIVSPGQEDKETSDACPAQQIVTTSSAPLLTDSSPTLCDSSAFQTSQDSDTPAVSDDDLTVRPLQNFGADHSRCSDSLDELVTDSFCFSSDLKETPEFPCDESKFMLPVFPMATSAASKKNPASAPTNSIPSTAGSRSAPSTANMSATPHDPTKSLSVDLILNYFVFLIFFPLCRLCWDQLFNGT